MPVTDVAEATDVERIIAAYFSAPQAQKADVLRRLFVDKLDFQFARQSVPLANPPKGADLPPNADVLARLQGVTAVYVPLRTQDTNRVRQREAEAAVKLLQAALTGDLVVAFSNRDGDQLHFIHPAFKGARPTLRRMVIERDLPRRTAVVQLAGIYHEFATGRHKGNLLESLNVAFDVEKVTKDFFKQYKQDFDAALELVQGFGPTEEDAKRLFVQTLFNRLMFVYFLSRKGWLKFPGAPEPKDYLNALWADYRKPKSKTKPFDESNFYESRLRTLFFTGLNNERSADLLKDEPYKYALIGDVPFLNGGLFDQDQVGDDKRPGITVPDEAIDLVLRNRPGDYGLFNRFNFTVMESTPFDIEVAVDPEMLGKVFEELVTGRHESGSYYTPRPVVSFMCREALKGYLEGENTGASPEAVRQFVDDKDPALIDLPAAPKVADALQKVTVVDPACGSGAYLLGMMHELVELQEKLFSSGLAHSSDDLYKLKLRIIERNLYGADIGQFAVNIAMLRLWLSLSVEFDGQKPPPLPNLDFKIICGDSLTGPNPENIGTLFRHRVHEVAGNLTALKGKHMRATGDEKRVLTGQIEKAVRELKRALSDDPAPAGAVDWRVQFAEVFDKRGGFDAVIANPPYVRKEAIPAANKAILLKNYSDAITGRSDLYCSFYARATQLLRVNGMHVFVCSNAWLDATYGAPLQEYLLGRCHIQAIYESSTERQFSTAQVNTAITVLRRKQVDRTEETRFVLLNTSFVEAMADPQNTTVTLLSQADLHRSGMNGADYVGNKWGGKYLRAPQIYRRIFGNRASRFIALGRVADVSGYIHDNNTGEEWPKRTVLWSVKDAAVIRITAKTVGVQRIGVNSSGNSTEYAPILFPRTFGTRHLVPWAEKPVLGKEFYKVSPHSSENIASIALQLNSTLAILQREILGIRGLGGGALKFAAADVAQFQMIGDLTINVSAKALASFLHRTIEDVDTELAQSDRRAVDDIMFDHLGLSDSERREVYDATFALVDARRNKAEHVTS